MSSARQASPQNIHVVMAAKEVATELGSKAAFKSRPVPTHGRIAPKHAAKRRPACVAGRSTGKRDGKAQVVRAVAAPEKEAYTPPPFQAWNSGAVLKKREDIKTIMILGAGPIVIGQVLCSCIFWCPYLDLDLALNRY